MVPERSLDPPEPDPDADLERRVERLEKLMVELRRDLAAAERDTAIAHELLALARRGAPPPGTPEQPQPPA